MAKTTDPNLDTIEEKNLDRVTDEAVRLSWFKNGKTRRAVDLDVVGLDAVGRELAAARLKLGPAAFAPPAIRAAEQATREVDAMVVSPQNMTKAGELVQASYNALAAEVRKAAADEVQHALDLQARCEEQARNLEQAGKDLAVILSAQNNTVKAMFDEQKKFKARQRNLEEQLVANGKTPGDEPSVAPDPEAPKQ